MTKVFSAQVTAGNNITIDESGSVSAQNVTSAQLDAVFGTQQGTLLFRGPTQWQPLLPGNPGSSFFSGGPNANPQFGVNPYSLEVNVKTDFNAKGDGVTDDWQALENARLFLVSKGGGRMFFPPGRYNMPTTAKNLTISSNIEYCGCGPASVIVGSNAVLVGPNNSHFNYTGYGDFTYYPANSVAAGDRQVVATTHTNASHFAVNDIVMIASTQTLPPNGLFYYMEINRVTAVDPVTGIISLEDTIEDAWSAGLQIANITTDVAQNYSVHDLALESINGHPNFISASYKGSIYNIQSHGFSVCVMNAFVRSEMWEVRALQNWSGATKYAAIELESGCVRASVHDIIVDLYGAGSTSGFPLIYPQEFTRRSHVANIRFEARGTDVGDLIQPATAGGHTFENIEFNGKSMDTMFRYTAVDDTKSALNGMQTTVRNVNAVLGDGTGNFYGGFTLTNNAVNGTVQNVIVEDCFIRGTLVGAALVDFYQGIQQNHVFRNVRGPGPIVMNTTGIADPNKPDVGTLTYPLQNVLFDGCEYTQLDSQVMLQAAEFRNCRRSGMPLPKYNASTLVWNSTVANHVEMQWLPPNAYKFCWGDCVRVKASFIVSAASLTFGAAHVLIKAFGTTIMQLDYAQNGSDQMTELDLCFDIVDSTFKVPDKFVGSGRVAINGVTQNERVPYFFHAFPNDGSGVQIQSWVDNASMNVTPMMVKIAFVPVEGRMAAGD